MTNLHRTIVATAAGVLLLASCGSATTSSKLDAVTTQPATTAVATTAAPTTTTVTITVTPTTDPGLVGSPTATQPTSGPRVVYRPVTTLTMVLSGTAFAAAAAGSIFGGLAVSDRNKLAQKPESGGCKPYCNDAQVAVIRDRALAADVLFSVAAASAVSAVISYLLRPEVPATTGRVELDLVLGSGSAGLGIRGKL